jgi:hypothetical protein
MELLMLARSDSFWAGQGVQARFDKPNSPNRTTGMSRGNTFLDIGNVDVVVLMGMLFGFQFTLTPGGRAVQCLALSLEG